MEASLSASVFIDSLFQHHFCPGTHPINSDYICCYYQFLFVVMEWEIIVHSNMDKKQKQNFKTFLQPIQSFFPYIHLQQFMIVFSLIGFSQPISLSLSLSPLSLSLSSLSHHSFSYSLLLSIIFSFFKVHNGSALLQELREIVVKTQAMEFQSDGKNH